MTEPGPTQAKQPDAGVDTAAAGKDAATGSGCCTYADFCKIELRVAEVIQAREHPNADRLLKLRLRVGEREKQICAGIKAWYTPADLVGKRVVIVDNLEPRKLRGEISEGMLLAAEDQASGRLTLVTVDDPAFPDGAGVH